MERRAGYHRSSAGGRESIVSESRSSRVTMQERADGKKYIRGYAAVYYRAGDAGTEYWLWDDIVERIAKGAFDGVLANDIRGLFNHNPDNLLGRSSAGSLRVSVDDIGFAYEIDEDSTDPDWQRVASKIDRGDLTGSSFAFIPKRSVWIEEEKYWVREIQEMGVVYDVGPVTYPAYGSTTAGRSAMGDVDPIVQELAAYRRSLIDQANEIDLVRMRSRQVDLESAEK